MTAPDKQRLLEEAAALQAIEAAPLDAEQMAFFQRCIAQGMTDAEIAEAVDQRHPRYEPLAAE